MMRKVGTTLVTIPVALSLAGLVFAATKQVTGEVVSVNPVLKTMVVSAQGQELTFSVEEKSAQALVGLKPGDKVTVQYTEIGGKRTAQAVTKS